MDKKFVGQVFSLSNRVIRQGKALDKLSGGALAAFFGGSALVGQIGGGLFWLPAAMGGAVLAYRIGIAAIHFQDYRDSRNFARLRRMREEFEATARNPYLTPWQKTQLDQAVQKLSPQTAQPSAPASPAVEQFARETGGASIIDGLTTVQKVIAVETALHNGGTPGNQHL